MVGASAAAGGLCAVSVLLSMWDAAGDMPWVAAWGGMYMARGVAPDDCRDGVWAIPQYGPARMGAVVTAAAVGGPGDIRREDIPAGDCGRAGSGRGLSIRGGVFRAGYH